MAPFIKRPDHPAKTLISRHRDGEMNAIAAEWLGVETIRGSGDHGNGFHQKGGVGAYLEMLEALRDGYSVALTADVPKISRVAGPGIVRLARDSGRPIYPVALASSRRFEIDNWDRSTVNLPFSRLVGVVGEPIRVPAETANGSLESARREVETSLNAATARAYAIADGTNGTPDVAKKRHALPITLRGYRMLTRALTPFAPLILKHRMKRGKEDPARLIERRGRTQVARPDGPVDLGAWRERRRTALGPSADRAPALGRLAHSRHVGNDDIGSAGAGAVSRGRDPSIHSARYAALSSRISSITGTRASACSSNPICGRI